MGSRSADPMYLWSQSLFWGLEWHKRAKGALDKGLWPSALVLKDPAKPAQPAVAGREARPGSRNYKQPRRAGSKVSAHKSSSTLHVRNNFFSNQFSQISTICRPFKVQVLWNLSWDCTGNLSSGLKPQNHEHSEGSATRPAPELLPYPCCKSRTCQQVCGPHGELRITPLSLLKITPPPFFGGEKGRGDRVSVVPQSRDCCRKCFCHVSRHGKVMLWQSRTHPLCRVSF